MTGLDSLVDALRLTVPLHVAELRARQVPPWLSREQMLTNIAARAAEVFATRGDALQFVPTSPSHYRSARRAGLALSEAIAAAALLHPDTGVEVFGAHFCAATHPGCPLTTPEEPEKEEAA